jgi:hypothetical protein
MRSFNVKALGLLAFALFISACTKGGNLTLEPSSNDGRSLTGSNYVSVDQGGAAKIASGAGYTAYVSIQPVQSTAVTSVEGKKIIINRSNIHVQ